MDAVLIANEMWMRKDDQRRKKLSSKLTLKRVMTMWIEIFWIMCWIGRGLVLDGGPG